MPKMIEKIGHYKSQEAEINKLKYLLRTAVRCSERRRKWIERAEHRNSCTFNGDVSQSDCTCGKLALGRTFYDYKDDMALRNLRD
jgi:hypothetical protein